MYGTAAQLPMTPGRRLWLAIGIPVCLVLVGWIGLNLIALIGPGQYPVSHDIPASARRVAVNVSEGRVDLRGVAGAPAKLTGAANYTLIRPAFTTKMTAAGPDFAYACQFPVGNCDLDATVSVPRGTATSVHDGGGVVTVTGTTGNVALTTDGGSITAERVSGDLALTTDGGDITASAITAPWVTATSGGGDVTMVFTRPPGNITVTTDGGSITIVVPPGRTHYHLAERTDGGTVSGQIPTDSSSPHVITATSRGGDITVRQS
jgi:Putative adhesin